MGERRTDHAKRRRHTPEQIVRKLSEADRLLAEGMEVPEVAKAREVVGAGKSTGARFAEVSAGLGGVKGGVRCAEQGCAPMTYKRFDIAVVLAVYWALRRVLELAVLLCARENAKELEILVLRHQLAVLRRQVARPALRPADRVLLSGRFQALPRGNWSAFFVRPETLQTSTLAKESYSYDNAGRLLETQETPAGKGCVVRLYAYEEESNRTSETAREPGTEGKCATEGGTVERHTYDEANRLTDEGVEYETFGNTTKMRANDAGGHELVSAYYVDSQVASQEQKKQLVDYTYDPLGRTLETTSENEETKAKSTKVFHYAGAGGALTWTSEGPEKWTRNVPGIDGSLCATQEAGKAAILQLHDLQGNIVATAADSESESKLLSTYNSTEFGVPNEGKTPPKYAWLGAAGVSTETSFESGVATQNGAAYVPQVARALQTAPVVPPGAFPNGQPGTQFTAVPGAWTPGDQAEANHATEEAEAERQKAREEEATRAAFANADDPWYTVITYSQMWGIINELNSLVENDDLHESALSQAPGIGQYLDLSWNTYKETILEPEIGRLAEEAKRMEREYRTVGYTAAFFVHYRRVPVSLPGPRSFLTGEEETVYIPWELGSESCSNEGTWGSGQNPANYTTYFLCASGVQRSIQGWPYD
jgi:hypothetical protein